MQRRVAFANHVGVRLGHDVTGGFVHEFYDGSVAFVKQAAIGDDFAVLVLDAWLDSHGIHDEDIIVK